MESASLRLSAFGDEISDDLDEQIGVLRSLNIGYLEVRGVWGKNVLLLSNNELWTLAEKCGALGIQVSAIGSPIGKSPIKEPISFELERLNRAFEVANRLGTNNVRVFSFFPPDRSDKGWSDKALLDESISRLNTLCNAAKRAGMTLFLENENGIVGDSVAHCQTLLEALESSSLGFAWDPGNFVVCGERTAVEDGWARLGPRTRHVHIKDVALATREVVPAGEGDGQIDLLLSNLASTGYTGFLALEPHLVVAGPNSGFSGSAGMAKAAMALRSLMVRLNISERLPQWAEGM